MSEDIKQVPICEKQGLIVGHQFTVVDKVPREIWRTGYNYYLAQRAKNGSVKPILGRYFQTEGSDDKQFQIHQEGAWHDANFWDWSEPVMENGVVVKNKIGKPKTRPFFEQKFEYLLNFEVPIEIDYWDKELKQVVTEEVNQCYVRFSKNLTEKVKDQVDDPRNAEGSKFILDYDPSKSPADQYKVKYVA